MKKRLLMMALAVASVVCSYAVNVGEYIYSNTNRFKVVAANQVANGNFSQGTAGWTGADDGWGVNTEGGPTGGSFIASTAAVETALSNMWQLSAGTYVFSYWAKSNEGLVTSVADGGTNYVNFFASADGTTNSRAVAEAVSIGTEWTQVVDTIRVVGEDEFLVFNASKVATGTAFTNFEVYKVSEVYDDRVVKRLIAYAKQLLQEPELANGQDDFMGVVMMMEEAIQDPGQNESAEAMEGLIASFNEEFDKFLGANGGNIDSGNWANRSSLGRNKINNTTLTGSWITIGGRWGFSANDASLERPEGDGYVASAGIQRSFDLGAVGMKVQNTNWAPGKYFFAIEAQEVAASNTAQPYGADHTKTFVGPSLYIGSDTLVMRPATEEEIAVGNPNFRYAETPDTLNGYYWKRYYMIGEVKEGETVSAGFIFPAYADKRGGRASLRNPVFRMLGKTDIELAWEAAVKAVYTQQTELKNRLDNYMTDVAEYLWSKDSLERAIAEAQPIYAASLEQVTGEAESTIAVTTEGVEELKALEASLLAQVNAMGRAKSYIINQNAIQDALKEAVADGQATLDDPLNAAGDATLRAALQTAVSEGQALIDGISTTNQYDEFNAAITKINETKAAFMLTTASRKNPAEVAIQNGDFALDGGNNTSADFTKNGWHFVGSGTYKQWQFGTAGTASLANQWRGYTVTLGGKGVQTVVISKPGLYEYRVQAYATNDNLTYRMGTANVILNEEEVGVDTTYYATPARVFFGVNGAPDSVVVAKCIAPGANSSGAASRPFQDINGYTAWNYSVIFEKTGNDEVEVEFGFEAEPLAVGQGLNAFGFGFNHVYFVGDKAKYTADTDADLQAEISRGQALIAKNTEVGDWAFINTKILRYIADAQAATDLKAKQNAYLSLKEMNDLIDNLTTGINAVAADNVVAAAKQGIYTLTGVKMAGNANSLKPGLYIINGKKYMVK
jgi:hypothetical protein